MRGREIPGLGPILSRFCRDHGLSRDNPPNPGSYGTTSPMSRLFERLNAVYWRLAQQAQAQRVELFQFLWLGSRSEVAIGEDGGPPRARAAVTRRLATQRLRSRARTLGWRRWPCSSQAQSIRRGGGCAGRARRSAGRGERPQPRIREVDDHRVGGDAPARHAQSPDLSRRHHQRSTALTGEVGERRGERAVTHRAMIRQPAHGRSRDPAACARDLVGTVRGCCSRASASSVDST